MQVPLEDVGLHIVNAVRWLTWVSAWFFLATPLIALLEYGTHRWIMHWANRAFDPRFDQYKSHRAHHRGRNDDQFVNMPLRNCLVLTSPLFLLLIGWGAWTYELTSIAAPAAALLAWCVVYTYLWTRLHRAIHGVELNWFSRYPRTLRFFRAHHLRHHVKADVNYGTIFPWTDYLFGTLDVAPALRTGKSVKPRPSNLKKPRRKAKQTIG